MLQVRKVYESVFERLLMKDTFRRLVVPNLDATGEYGTDFGRPRSSTGGRIARG